MFDKASLVFLWHGGRIEDLEKKISIKKRKAYIKASWGNYYTRSFISNAFFNSASVLLNFFMNLGSNVA